MCNGQSDCMERGRCARDTKAGRHNLCRTKPWFWFQFFQQWLNFELPMYLNNDPFFGKKYMMKPNTFNLNIQMFIVLVPYKYILYFYIGFVLCCFGKKTKNKQYSKFHKLLCFLFSCYTNLVMVARMMVMKMRKRARTLWASKCP